MIAEGQVRVSAVLEGGRLAAVRATTDRPLIGDLLLRGRAPAEAPGLLSLALSLCGRSQAVVCAAACEAAGATRQQQAVSEHRSRELAAETVQEHAWRLTLDWPRLAGEPEDMELLGRMRALARSAPASDAAWGAARDALLSLVSSRLLGERADGWLESRSASDWLAWADHGHTSLARTIGRLARMPGGMPSKIPFLARPASATVIGSIAEPALADPSFARFPVLAGSAQETGPLARLSGHHAIDQLARTHVTAARVFARLAEMIAVLTGEASPGEVASASLGAGRGVAWAEMARGLLTHVVEIADGRIARYAIVAPTEWNFHPAGALPAALEGAVAADDEQARRLLEATASALDPCVALRVELRHA